MAWWDANSPRNHRGGTSLLRLSNPTKDLALGDAFPKLNIVRPLSMPADLLAMDHDRIILSPISEELLSPLAIPIPPLTVHVNIQFTDPVIRRRYNRSYTSSQTFEPTERICNGLLRRIELCSEELLTRKDSTSLDQYKDGTYERKSMRFEITFRIVRRGMGEWAERTFRSYQKQPLTVGLTKDIILATDRMVGLFLRQHDNDFRWLDDSAMDHSPEAPETFLPSPDGPLSLLCIPRSRFIESSQSFEFVPGYTIQLSFRSRNSARAVPVFKRTIKLSSKQPTPISLLTSENILWKGLHAINHALESKKQEFDAHSKTCRRPDCLHSIDNALSIDLSISNNLGPAYRVYRNIQSTLSLFRDPEATDCDEFLQSIEASLVEARDDSDSKMNELDDFEFNIVELRGHTGVYTSVRWSVMNAAKFSCGSSASYGRRTIQAMLDRIQTGIGDVLRDNNIAVQISAHKRGHLILDKAIIAREKSGRPAETFPTQEEQQNTFVARLKTRIQRDIDMVLRDTCSIADIAEDEEDTRQPLTLGPEAGYVEQRGGSIRAASPTKSTRKSIKTYPDSLQGSPTKAAVQRSFSLGHRSISSVASVISAKNLDEFRSVDITSESGSRRSSLSAQDLTEDRLFFGDSAVSTPGLQIKPQRRFSLLPRNPSSTRVSSASTLICESIGALEESSEVNAVQDNSTEGKTVVKAELSDPDKVWSNDRSDPMTLNEVDNNNSASEPTGMVPEDLLERLARDMTPNVIAHAEVMPPDAGFKLDNNLPTMDAFEDAQEYSTGIGLAIPIDTKVDRLTSPAADEYSTAPSTPALSLGGDSSPRHSVLATPTYLRTISDTKGDNILRDFEPESEAEESGADIMDASPAETNMTPELQQEIGSGPDNHGSDKSTSSEGMQNGRLDESDSAATERGNVLVPSHTTAPTPTSDIECSNTPLSPAGGCTDKQRSNNVWKDLFDEHNSKQEDFFGAEGVVAESDEDSQSPDFPTSNVRRSALVESEGHISDADVDSALENDGTEFGDGAVSANNPFVVLIDEVKADPEGKGLQAQEKPEQEYIQDDAETQTEPVAESVVPEESVKDQLPEETVPDISLSNATGSDMPEPSGPEVKNELSEPANLPGPFKFTEDTFISPVGSAVVALDAEVLEAAGWNESKTSPEGTDNTDPEELGKTLEAETDDHSILNKASETRAEVPQPHASEGFGLHEDGAVVGVLDQNIGTDPEPVLEVISDDQLQGLEEGFTRSRRASELEEDICGHEYSTGNRVGYAAVCLPSSDKPVTTNNEEAETWPQGDDRVMDAAPRDEGMIRGKVPEAEESETPGVVVIEQFVPDDEMTEPEASELHGDVPSKKSPDVEESESPAVIVIKEIIPDDEIPPVAGSSELQGDILANESPETEESEVLPIVVVEQITATTGDGISEKRSLEPEATVDQINTGNEFSEKEDFVTKDGYSPTVIAGVPAVFVIDDEAVEADDEITTGNKVLENIVEYSSFPESADAPAAVIIEQITTTDEVSEKHVSRSEATGKDAGLDAENTIILPHVDESPAVLVIETETENIPLSSLKPEVNDDQLSPDTPIEPETPPKISVKDYEIPSAQYNTEPEPLSDNGAESETPKPDGAVKFNPDFINPFAPISDLEVGRTSVDTIRCSFEENVAPEENENSGYQSRPQTAGYLGLGDTRRIKVGLGHLGGGGGGVRRYSLPLQYMLDDDVSGGRNGSVVEGKVNGGTWGKVMRGLGHRSEEQEEPGRKGKQDEEATLSEESSAEEAIYDGPTVVPRMMMLLAGVVAIGKVLKGSGAAGN